MIVTPSEYVNKLYYFAVTFALAYGASMATRKLVKVNLGVPQSLETVLKLSAVLSACALGVDYAQEKKWLPEEIIKKVG